MFEHGEQLPSIHTIESITVIKEANSDHGITSIDGGEHVKLQRRQGIERRASSLVRVLIRVFNSGTFSKL